MNRKQQQFFIWCQIIMIIANKEHVTHTGLKIIRNMRETMRHVGGK